MEMNIGAVLGQRLRELREAHGWTQELVAYQLKLSAPTIANYEAGKRDPSTETLVGFAELFDVSLDYLLGLTERPGYTGKRLYLKDYLPHFPPDVRNWVAKQEVAPFVLVAKELAEAGLDPASIRSIAQTIHHEILRHRPPTRHDAQHTDDDSLVDGERTSPGHGATNPITGTAETRRENTAATEQTKG